MARDYFLGGIHRGEDDDGQPRAAFPAQHLNNAAKALEDLSSICRGILCDGELNSKEADYFQAWLKQHSQFNNIPWFVDLHKRVRPIFEDGIVDEEEKVELKSILEHIRGGDDLLASYSSPLPLDSPPPTPIIFSGQTFCITGKFAFGKRSRVIDAISMRGGSATDNQPSQSTNYLLIGKFCSRDWLEASYGTKIVRASQLRDQGFGIKIVGEDHWRTFLEPVSA